MDSLPSELVSHILSYCNRREVLRYKALSPRFKQRCERSLILTMTRYPTYNVLIRNDDDGPDEDRPRPLFDIHIERVGSFTLRRPDFSNNEVAVTPRKSCPRHSQCSTVQQRNNCFFFHGDSTEFTSTFFGDFFTKSKNSTQSLEAMFDFIFEKINVNELQVIHWECIEALSKTIRRSPAPIGEIRIPLEPGVPDHTGFWDILRDVGEHPRIGRNHPKMVVYASFRSASFSEHWPEIMKTNEIAPLYESCLLKFEHRFAADVILNIAKEWVKNPTIVFHFDLCIPLDDYQPRRLEILDDDDQFDIIETNVDRFLFHPDPDEDASVELRDRITGKAIVFRKRNGSAKTVRGAEDAVHVSIEIHN